MTEHLHYVEIGGKRHVCRGRLCGDPNLMTSARPTVEGTGCIHRGQQSGMVSCPSCRGSVQLKVFDCAVPEIGRCTIAKRAAGVGGCCLTCHKRTPPMNEGVTRVNLPDHYNCSIVEHGGRLLMSSRLDRPYSQTWISELGPDLQPLWSRKVADGWEDARLFSQGGVLFCSHGQFEGGVAHVHLARLTDVGTLVFDTRLELVDRQPWEKNWAPFVHGDEGLFVYSVRPHVVVGPAGGAVVAKRYATVHGFDWPGHELRGGAPPVMVDGLWWHWFHSVKREGGRVVYGGGVYAFEPESPFKVVKACRQPIIMPDPREPMRGNKSVVFPCGAVYRDGWWHVSYGVDDRECRIAAFEHSWVERQMAGVD